MARAGGIPLPTITDDRALGAADIQRSLRFNRGDSPYLSRALGSPTSDDKASVSVWLKRTDVSTDNSFFDNYQGSNDRLTISLVSSTDGDGVGVYHRVSSGIVCNLLTTQKFSDPASWYHILVAFDTTQSTEADRVKIYVNGTQITSFSSSTYFSQNHNLRAGSGYTTNVGRYGAGSNYFGGYMAEFNYIDGQQLSPTDVGFTDSQTGMWMPRRYEGTYGNNGFYLDFSDNSRTASLGIDKSPNGNDFTTNNFSVSSGDGNDSRTDTPTLRKATLNSITGWSSNATLENGALEMTGSAGFKEISTIAIDGTSKLYYELVRTNAAGWQLVGIFIGQPNNPSNALTNSAIWGFASTQAQYFGGTYTSTGNVPSWSVGNVMGIKYENGTLKLYKDGTLATSVATGIPTSDIIFAYIANDNTNAASFVRFDSDSWTQATAAGVDSTWEISGKNLPPNVPSIVRPQRHFDILTYTGDQTDGTRSITGLEFTPDFVWLKCRSSATSHNIYDSVRGFGSNKEICSDKNQVEGGEVGAQYGYVNQNSRGFDLVAGSDSTLGSRVYNININSATYVAWCWKAGGAAVANSDGATASQVSVNTEAGFSIVTYTGTGSSTTIGHGLGKKPEMIFMKSRSATGDWAVLDEANSTAEYTFYLNDNNAYGSSSGYTFYADTTPTSSVWTVNSASATNASGVTYVAYCWTSIPGYSKIGKYSGNSSSDGAYVHLGFRPAWVLFKRNDYGGNWFIVDNKRDPFNECTRDLYPNNNNTETNNSNFVDFLSNGFKLRTTGTAVNAGTIIYMAFAEQQGQTPFDTFPNAR